MFTFLKIFQSDLGLLLIPLIIIFSIVILKEFDFSESKTMKVIGLSLIVLSYMIILGVIYVRYFY